MAHGYPDWSRLTQIIGSDIMVPMDIQGSMIQVPVDIQAQFVTVDINLKASEITLDINIAATAVTLDVNLKAQDVNINIDIEAQSVGVYLQTDWSVYQGYDKLFTDEGTSLGSGVCLDVSYVVPAGREFKVMGMSASVVPSDPVNYDHHFPLRGRLYYVGPTVNMPCVSGDGGIMEHFSQPQTVPADKTVEWEVCNYSNLVVDMRIAMWGFDFFG